MPSIYKWEWFKQYRPEAREKAKQHQQKGREPSEIKLAFAAIKAKEEEIEKLQAELKEHKKALQENCVHLVKYQELEEGGYEDDYGGWLAGMWFVLRCSKCDTELERWETER